MSPLLSRTEAAEYLGISTDTLDRMRATGKIAAFKVPGGRLVKFPRRALEAFIEHACATSLSDSATAQTGTSSGMKLDVRDVRQLARQTVARLRRSSSQSA